MEEVLLRVKRCQSRNQTQQDVKLLEQDTTVIHQVQDTRLDTGHVESGNNKNNKGYKLKQ